MGRFNALLDQTKQRDDDNVRHVAACECPRWSGYFSPVFLRRAR